MKGYFLVRHLLAMGLVCSALSCTTNPSDRLLTADCASIRISSPDTLLVNIFNWAQTTSNGYAGSDSDPVGPWYEAALPNREAFCIRDVSHQCIGAEILWQGKQNLNMFRKFVENISEARDFCSYWEINRYNKPAPVDYASDDDFWYNLNANFDIIDACYKLYQWTGNGTYIFDPVFDNFFQLTLNQYVERWQLQPDKIMQRPALMNLKAETVKYKYARGIPSYDESQDDLTVSGDLLGMIYNGFKTYAQILKLKNQEDLSRQYSEKASAYRHLIDSLWWDESSQAYFAFYKTDKKFNAGWISNSEFLLWYQVIDDPAKINRSLRGIRNSQIEVLSYLPMLFYRYGYNQDGYEFLGKIFTDKRRMYPEASSGAIEGIVRGLMGVEPSAIDNRILSCPRLTQATPEVTVENIPVFTGLISVRHESASKTTFANKSDHPLTWRAAFQGSFKQVLSGGKAMPATQFTDALGNIHSYVDISVNGRSSATAEADTAQVARNPKWPGLEEVILVWKTHNDIGYTHPVPEVLNYYRNGMMDGALKLINDTLSTPKSERFVWVLPAWVMEVILDDKQTPERRVQIEKAIRDGRIVWHALPYTFESEAADLEELVRGLGSGTRQAKKFGQFLPADAKLTDMPSQAWVLPSLLVNAGIRFVHIGVNPWSPNPDVPKLFWWEGPDGSRLLTGYAFHSYSWEPLPPEGWSHKTWLCFQVTGDNSGPPSRETVRGILDKLHRELPGVRIRFGRSTDFADAIIRENSPDIPVIRGNMPDSWTHGQMTMPVPTRVHREAAPALASLGILSTEMQAWKVPVEDVSPTLAKAYEQGSLFSEHTWGIAGPMFGTPDHATWKKELAAGKYDSLLGTFEWHANYARKAEQLSKEGIMERMTSLAKSIKTDGPRVVVFNPQPWQRSGIVTVEIPSGDVITAAMKDLTAGNTIPVVQSGRLITFRATEVPAGGYRTYIPVAGLPVAKASVEGETVETRHFRVKFDTKRGGIASLVNLADGRELAATGTHAFGQFMHERFSKKEVDAFMKAYCEVYYDWYGFPYYDFNKPRLDSTLPYAMISPEEWSLKINREALGYRASLQTENTKGLAENYALDFFFPNDQPYIEISWRVTGKTPELIPEGGWLCFPLAIENPVFRVSQVSAPFSPERELVAGSNHHLFSTDYGISVRTGTTGNGVGVASSDLPLWSLGEPGLWKYTKDYVPRKAELFANLYNNQWNTNYPLWISGSWSASVRLWPIVNGATEEEALFTPGWELRQDLLTGYASGVAGSLRVNATGISLSRKGIRVTAFCPNPDADLGVPGTLVRVWEQSGQSGEVELSLPTGFKATSAQPISLRGEKIGKPVKIRQGKIGFYLKAYAPVSFVLN
ncbi:MAG: hypothetical protein WC699_05370 [Bacteroidales bacterium]|jgi:hypothetical protein